MVDIFKEGKFELLALMETELMASLLMFRRLKELGKGWPSC